LSWEVKADPRSGIKEGCPVVAIVAILLPHHTSGGGAETGVGAGGGAGTAHTGTQPQSVPHSTAHGLKCGLVAVDRAGVVTVWDLAVLASKSFGSKGGPTCLMRLCLYDHPAVLYHLPSYGYDTGSTSRIPATFTGSTGSTVVGLCAFPRSTESESESVPKGLTDSKDNDVLCVTFSNGRVMLLDLMKRRIGENSSPLHVTRSSSMLVPHTGESYQRHLFTHLMSFTFRFLLFFSFLSFPSIPFLSFHFFLSHIFLTLSFLFCPSAFFLFLLASFLSYPILSYPILSYPILSYPILSYPILTYPCLLTSHSFSFL
jgi:hypothetical protein